MTFFQMVSVVIILSIAAYTYIKKFHPLMVALSIISLVAMWTVVFLWRKYLQVSIAKSKDSLQKK